MKKAIKNIKKVLNIFCWILIAVLVLMVTITMISKLNGETPSMFGYSIYRVSSKSMEPELIVGDVILSHKLENPQDLKEGDVVTFDGANEYEGRVVTHEIIKEPYEENGVLMVQTKGVANPTADTPITTDSIKGIMVSKIPVLDTIYNIFFSRWGLLILILLLVFIFVDEIIVIVRILLGHDKTADDGEDINEIIERLQKENNAKKDEKP